MSGWPVRLAGGNCYSGLLTAGDGSVRVVCWRRSASSEAGAPSHVVFGLDAHGNTMPGWPVIPPPEADANEKYYDQRVVGISFVLVAGDWFGRDQGYEDWLVTIEKDGVVSSGVHIPTHDQPWMVALQYDETAYFVEAVAGCPLRGSQGHRLRSPRRPIARAGPRWTGWHRRPPSDQTELYT